MTLDSFLDRFRGFGGRPAIHTPREVLCYESLLGEISRSEDELNQRRIAPRELVGIAADFGPSSVALL
ncbi:MAG: hypothetical protein HKP27_15625, partial [Myxococcales bacterium]|nr:hypothetical protein [Myxococcales bacterium]